MKDRKHGVVVILDFGSQYTQLIARRVRDLKIYSVVLPCNAGLKEIESHHPQAIILSGGPFSIYSKNAPGYDQKIFSLNLPILGICYGMQLLVQHFGGQVQHEGKSEYGYSQLILNQSDPCLFLEGVEDQSQVWMSHQDQVSKLPVHFKAMAHSNHCIAGVYWEEKKIYGIQFHPEVEHSEAGVKIIENFLVKIAGLKQNWVTSSFIDQEIQNLREKIGHKKVILALSGGVDSSVLALLLHKAINDQLLCIFIDNGLLRSGEKEQVINTFKKNFKINLKVIQARKFFLRRLRFVKNPERKRKIIGRLFLKVLLKYSRGYAFLAQGTLYPDVIESVSFHGPSDKIKTHHNRVKPILKMIKKGRVIEPFATLFKDEVRKIGVQLGLPLKVIKRQPFPGPGLAVRILGRVTPSRLEILRKADQIFLEEMSHLEIYENLWQAFAVLLPVKSVGVVGDNRCYGYTIALRAISSSDGMTADFEIPPKKDLTRMVSRIIGEISRVTRVVWDISSKPPATIEWE